MHFKNQDLFQINEYMTLTNQLFTNCYTVIYSLLLQYFSRVFKHNVISYIPATVTSHTSGDNLDNNLGPDRLAGPKALDPNYFRQPTL